MEQNAQSLIRISEKKQQLLAQMLDLTQQQADAIEAEDAELLQRLTEQRQELICGVDVLDKQFAADFDVLKRSLGITSLEDMQPGQLQGSRELKSVVVDIMELIREIRDLDTENSEKAQVFLQEITGEIQKLNQTKKLQSAYKAPTTQPSAYFLDKKQ